eukprot:jgi/Psemu1/307528/fgenesh1_kg.336_\
MSLEQDIVPLLLQATNISSQCYPFSSSTRLLFGLLYLSTDLRSNDQWIKKVRFHVLGWNATSHKRCLCFRQIRAMF